MHAIHGKGACATESIQELLISRIASTSALPCSYCAGSIARTCAATGVGLHLVGPLGFRIDSSRLKRAGLDYWPYVAVNIYATWQVIIQGAGSRSLTPQLERWPATHPSPLIVAIPVVHACIAACVRPTLFLAILGDVWEHGLFTIYLSMLHGRT